MVNPKNPYEAPRIAEESPPMQAASVGKLPTSKFRWRVIPASLSWLLGCLSLVALPFAVYNNWQYLGVDTNNSLPGILHDIAHLAMFPILAAFGVAFLYAGNRWMQGRWITAIALNVVAYLLLVGIITGMDYLGAWARQLP